MTSLLFLDSDVIPTSSKGKGSDGPLYTVRSLVMVRAISCQRNCVVEPLRNISLTPFKRTVELEKKSAFSNFYVTRVIIVRLVVGNTR